jgi:hypothetical protein
MERINRWLTFRLVSLAAKLHWPMFIKLCETAVIAHHRDKIEEAIRDALRLEQEHDYDNQEEDYDTDSDTPHGNKPTNTNTNRKLH